jgi:hypothetical protein
MPQPEAPKAGPTLSNLAANFDAALARSEDEAASDLALSFRQGRTLADVLLRAGGVEARLRDGLRCVVTIVGDDFCGGGDPVTRAMPWGGACFQSSSVAAPPNRYHGDLMSLAREWTRRGARVEVASVAGNLQGVLAEVGSDYLCVVTKAGRCYVGRAALTEISLLSERTSGGT